MTNVHIYPSTFEYETRILKITKALVENNISTSVMIVAKSSPGLPNIEHIDKFRSVFRIGPVSKSTGFWRKALHFVYWSFNVYRKLRKTPVTMINCHSLSVLPLSVWLKIRHKAILVYEPHELETETPRFSGVKKRVAKFLEGTLIKHAKTVITVSDSISSQYASDYAIDVPHVVMNVPETSVADSTDTQSLRTHFNLPDDAIIFMYQGALDEERGILQLLQAFCTVSNNKHLVLMGFGGLEDKIKRIAASRKNIHYFSSVPPDQIMYYTMNADVGIALLEDNCLNHQYALPNKLFHYLHAGLPVIVNDLYEMGRLVDKYQCGWKVKLTAQSLRNRIDAINSEALDKARSGSFLARENYQWKYEERKMLDIYKDIVHK